MDGGAPAHTAEQSLTGSNTLRILIRVAAFTLAMAIGAQVRIPLPFTPVPITLQTFVVLCAGLVLGAGWGAVSAGLYVALGAVGAPVFTAGGAGLAHLTGATAGYLLALPVAAYLAGWLSGSEMRRQRVYPALFLAGLLILFIGTSWIALLFGRGVAEAAALGFWPFLVGDVVKTVAAAEVGIRIGRLT